MKKAFYLLNAKQRLALIFFLICLVIFHLISFGLHPLFGSIAPLTGCLITVLISGVTLDGHFFWRNVSWRDWKIFIGVVIVCLGYFVPAYITIYSFPLKGNLISPPKYLVTQVGVPFIFVGFVFHIVSGLLIRKTKYFL